MSFTKIKFAPDSFQQIFQIFLFALSYLTRYLNLSFLTPEICGFRITNLQKNFCW